jgi:hypothetical protein
MEPLNTTVARALDAFWKVVAEATPEATSGDLDPQTDFSLTLCATEAVERWREYNANMPLVKGVDWSGASCRLERAGGEPVRIGEKIRGYTVTGGRPPHKEGSSGRVWVTNEEGGTGEFFPHVLELHWVRR